MVAIVHRESAVGAFSHQLKRALDLTAISSYVAVVSAALFEAITAINECAGFTNDAGGRRAAERPRGPAIRQPWS